MPATTKPKKNPKNLPWGALRPHHAEIAEMLRSGGRYDDIASFLSRKLGREVTRSAALTYIRRRGLKSLSPIYGPLPQV